MRSRLPEAGSWCPAVVQTGGVNTWWVSVEYGAAPSRTGPPVVSEPCADVVSTDVSPEGRTTVNIFAVADTEDDARERALRVAGKVADSVGLPQAPQSVNVEMQRTFLT